MKTSLENVQASLLDHNVGAEKTEAILCDLEAALQEEKADRGPRAKKQTVILVSDPRGELPETDFVGWALEIPEALSPSDALELVTVSAHSYNTSRKGRRCPVTTIGEALEATPVRTLKEAGVTVRNRTPVFMMRTDNVLRPDASDSRL